MDNAAHNAPSAKKVAIIGTSNSILREGWTEGFKQFYPSVTNFSLGASPSLYAHYILHKHDILNKFDLVIIDFALNDSFFMQHDTIDSRFLLKSFDSLLNTLANQRHCAPIILNFVNKLMFKHKTFSTYDLYNLLASAHGIPYFPVGDLIARTRLPLSHPNFFLDDWHIARAIGRIFGETLGATTKHALNLRESQNEHGSGQTDLAFSTLSSGETKAVNTALSPKKTSLASYDAYDFNQDSRLILAKSHALCALFLCQPVGCPCCISIAADHQNFFCQKAKTTVNSQTFMFKSLYRPVAAQTSHTLLFGRHHPKICRADCNVRDIDTLTPFAFIDALFVENYHADDVMDVTATPQTTRDPLNLVNHLDDRQLHHLTRQVLSSLT